MEILLLFLNIHYTPALKLLHHRIPRFVQCKKFDKQLHIRGYFFDKTKFQRPRVIFFLQRSASRQCINWNSKSEFRGMYFSYSKKEFR